MSQELSFDKFKSLVDEKTLHFSVNSEIFSVSSIEFSLKDENCPFPYKSFEKYISNCLKEKFLEKDFFAVDEKSKFYLYLSSMNKHFAILGVVSLINELKQSVGTFIEIKFVVEECTKPDASFGKLFNSTKPPLDNNAQKPYENIVKIQDKTLEAGMRKTFNNIQVNVKTILFKELYSLLKTISDYDSYLGAHTALVTKGSTMLAKELGLPISEVRKIAIAALLHDIGYTVIPKEIFLKQSKLSQDEWKLIKMHPTIACEQLLKSVKILQEYIPYVQDHHEYMDGSGYPRGKKGDLIPYGAQIISVIDSYQAMIVDRPYRKALSFEDILNVYIRNAGIKWDDSIITMFTAMIADPKTRKELSDKSNLSISRILFDHC